MHQAKPLESYICKCYRFNPCRYSFTITFATTQLLLFHKSAVIQCCISYKHVVKNSVHNISFLYRLQKMIPYMS